MRVLLLSFGFLLLINTLVAQAINPKLKITALTHNFYIYTTYNTYENTQVPANGMYVVTKEGVVMFDTPWDTTQFQPLLDSIQARHHQPVIMAFATHWHSDKTAGLEYYRQKGIKTYTTRKTDELSKKNGAKRAALLMDNDTLFQVGAYQFQTYYPGPGHTEDNIVIWFPKEKVLYGGCLIKGASDTNLGFLGDGNVKEYIHTLKRIQEKYPQPKHIIVAHSDWADLNSLTHSIEMAELLHKKEQP
ncbi:MAG: BlaB/IND/MUS family subclass B1 metallo-beta-lactamase [Chitinophagaceae bacterium]|nr:BlaB/IND/MUS family subclass B1 metallo-beta-lactamase [Chitinophagaceae bacterium]